MIFYFSGDKSLLTKYAKSSILSFKIFLDDANKAFNKSVIKFI